MGRKYRNGQCNKQGRGFGRGKQDIGKKFKQCNGERRRLRKRDGSCRQKEEDE